DDFPGRGATAQQTCAPAAAGGEFEHVRMLELALENTTHGLCVYDAGGRLQIVNKRYLEIHNFTPDAIKRGWSFLDLMRHQVRSGNFAGDPDSYVAELDAELQEKRVVERHH